MKTEIFKKEYDGESLSDVNRDVIEVFDSRYNDLLPFIPDDENGFATGSFVVTIEWIPGKYADNPAPPAESALVLLLV